MFLGFLKFTRKYEGFFANFTRKEFEGHHKLVRATLKNTQYFKYVDKFDTFNGIFRKFDDPSVLIEIMKLNMHEKIRRDSLTIRQIPSLEQIVKIIFNKNGGFTREYDIKIHHMLIYTLWYIFMVLDEMEKERIELSEIHKDYYEKIQSMVFNFKSIIVSFKGIQIRFRPPKIFRSTISSFENFETFMKMKNLPGIVLIEYAENGKTLDEDLDNPNPDEFQNLVQRAIDKFPDQWNDVDNYVVYVMFEIVRKMTLKGTWQMSLEKKELDDKIERWERQSNKHDLEDKRYKLHQVKKNEAELDALLKENKKQKKRIKHELKRLDEESKKHSQKVRKIFEVWIKKQEEEKKLIKELEDSQPVEEREKTIQDLKNTLLRLITTKIGLTIGSPKVWSFSVAERVFYHLLSRYSSNKVFSKFTPERFFQVIQVFETYSTIKIQVNEFLESVKNTWSMIGLNSIIEYIFRTFILNHETLQKIGVEGVLVYIIYYLDEGNVMKKTKFLEKSKIQSLINTSNINESKEVNMIRGFGVLNNNNNTNIIQSKMLGLVSNQIGELIAEQKRKIMNKIDTRNAPWTRLTDEILVKFIEMDNVMKESIHSIIIMPKFKYDLKTKEVSGYVILFHPNAPMVDKFFKMVPLIGKCTASYRSSSKNPEFPSKENEELLRGLLIGDKKRDGLINGPTLRDRVEVNDTEGWKITVSNEDNTQWVQKMEKGDWISNIFSVEDKHVKMVIKSTARHSSEELQDIISKYISSKLSNGEVPSLRELVRKSGSLSGVYNAHITNCLRNNERIAWEVSRFFQLRLNYYHDSMSIRGSTNTYPKNAIPEYTQYSNVFRYHEGLNPRDYYKHVVASRRGKKMMYNGGEGGGCIAYYNECSPVKFFRKKDISSRLEQKKSIPKEWNMLMKLDDHGSMGQVSISCDVKSSTFLAFSPELPTQYMRMDGEDKSNILSSLNLKEIQTTKVEVEVDNKKKDFFSIIGQKLEAPSFDEEKLEQQKMIEDAIKNHDPVLKCKVIRFGQTGVKSSMKEYKLYNSNFIKNIEKCMCSTLNSSTKIYYSHSNIVIE